MTETQEIKQEKTDAKLVDVAQLAQILGVTGKTVHNYKNEGKIPYLQVGRTVLFDLDEVLQIIKKKPAHG